MMKRATIKDVAARAGVSVASVSYVLNETGSVGQAVRERVLESVRVLGYRSNQSAKTTRTGRSQALGLIVPDLANPFFPGLAQAFEDAARRSGFAVLLIDSADGAAEAEGFDLLARYGVDGICWCPASKKDSGAAAALGVPVVVIDRPMPGYDLVQSDNATGGALIAGLVSLTGATRVGILGGPRGMPGSSERARAIREALKATAKVVWESRTPFSFDLAKGAQRCLVEEPVDFIVCTSDVLAIAAMRALARLGRSIPHDVAVTGFDDIAWSMLVTPSLTTVRQPVADMGREALRLLVDRISYPERLPQQVLLPVELIVRETTPTDSAV